MRISNLRLIRLGAETMKNVQIVGAITTGAAAAAAAAVYWWMRRQGPRLYIFAGCYTQPRQADPFESQGGVPHDAAPVGEGIYLVEVGASGELCNRGVVAKGVRNPSYVCPVPAKAPRVLYAVSEADEAGAEVVAFAVEGKTLRGARLRRLNAQRTEGGHPCMVAAHRGIVVTCNYSGGSFSCFEQQAASGELSKLVQLIRHEGSSVDSARQEAAHAHSVAFSDHHPGGFMYACDLGSDSVVSYQLQPAAANERGGVYSFQAVARFDAPPGWGPRHLALHPSRALGLIMCEMSARLVLVRLLPSGSLAALAETPALLPDGWPGADPMARFNEGRWGADVCWGADGRFAYASLRLINLLVVLRLPEAQDHAAALPYFAHEQLEVVQRIPSGGLTPRNMALAPGGELLVVGHQHSHSLVSFRVDASSGRLTPTGKAAHVPCVSCVKFVQE